MAQTRRASGQYGGPVGLGLSPAGVELSVAPHYLNANAGSEHPEMASRNRRRSRELGFHPQAVARASLPPLLDVRQHLRCSSEQPETRYLVHACPENDSADICSWLRAQKHSGAPDGTK